MKKIVLSLLMSLVAMSSQAQTKCDFSGITFEKLAQRGNEYYFATNMHSDSCWRYYFTVYDYQLKKLDTLEDWGGRAGAAFYAKGKYQARLNVFNICLNCDTVFTYDVDITIFGKDAKCDVQAAKGDCKVYKFQMKNFWDTCMQYYYQVWDGDDWINKMSDTEWKNLSDSALYFGYSWEEKLLEYYTEDGKSPMMQYRFSDSGRYFVIPTYYNKCTEIDTWMFVKVDVCKTVNTTNVTKLKPTTNISIVGYYDMLGRRVDAIEPNKIYIILYSNGSRRKVMQVQ